MGNNVIAGSLPLFRNEQSRIFPNASDRTALTAPNSKRQPPEPAPITVRANRGENPRELHRRILLEAASQAGLDGTDAQKRFVEQFLDGLEYLNSKNDPSPDDNMTVKSKDIKNEYLKYQLNPKEIIALQQLRTEYVKGGGTLRQGKVYDYSTEGRTLTAGEQRSGKRGITTEQYERQKMRDLMEKAQILPSTFGTPSKLRELKHVSINAPDEKPVDNDRALRLYVDSRFGAARGGNLWGDKLDEITQLAKTRGVRVENTQTANGKIEFDISVENLLKLQHTYIGVQEQFNTAEKIADTARDKRALNQFLIGAGEGAWGAVKANYEMVRHPVQTVSHIQEAVTTLANLKQEDLLKIYDALKAEGKAFIFEKDISEVSREMGKVVGAALVEFALGKGIGAGLTALRGLPAATAFLKTANELKQTIGKLPVPTPGMKVVVDTMGNKMVFPDVELTKLEDLIKPMESRAQQVLSGGKAINLPSWNKLTFKLENDGKTIHLINNHTVTGKGYQSSVRMGGSKDVFPEQMTEKQIFKAVREAYENSKKIGTQINDKTGDKIVELVGYSKDGMKIKIYINVTKKQLDTAFPQ